MKILYWPIGLTWSLLCATAVPAFGAAYTVVNLGQGTVAGINASGQVLGQYADGDNFIYTSATSSYLDIGSAFVAQGINDSGEVCGYQGTNVVLYSNGNLSNLGTPLGGVSFCRAYNVNNAGEITGQIVFSSGAHHGFIYNPANPDNGGYTDLGTLSGNSADNCYGDSINQSGQIEGDSTADDVDHYTHAFIWTNGTMLDLGTFGGPNSSGIQVNNLGHATGTSEVTGSGNTPSTWISDIFFYNGTTTIDCGRLAGDNYANAGGMNDSDVIVGISTPNATVPDSEARAVIYENGALTDLNTLIPDNTGLTLNAAMGINDAGQIVVNATDAGGNEYAVLLNPVIVPEPAGAGLILAAGAIVLRYRGSQSRLASLTQKNAS